MSSRFSSTMPMSTAEMPAYALRNEMTVGMSAPPIGISSATPNASASTMMIGTAHDAVGSMTRYTPSSRAPASSERFTMFWNG
jgi:hypothetical protein